MNLRGRVGDSPLQWRDRVNGLELAPRGHHVVALLAIALDMNPLVLMPVLHHHNQTSPALQREKRRGKIFGYYCCLMRGSLCPCRGRRRPAVATLFLCLLPHLGQIVGGHALATLMPLSLGQGETDDGIRK